MIGLSLGGCCAAMARGEVDPATVEKIITGTRCRDEASWQRALEGYVKTWGPELGEKAKAIAEEFRKAGKIVQPRLDDNDLFPNTSKGIWVEEESQVRYGLPR